MIKRYLRSHRVLDVPMVITPNIRSLALNATQIKALWQRGIGKDSG
ncbi:hypothetical protein [Trichormus azollae]